MCNDNISNDLERNLLELVISLGEAVEEKIEVVNRKILQPLVCKHLSRVDTYLAKESCQSQANNTALTNYGFV